MANQPPVYPAHLGVPPANPAMAINPGILAGIMKMYGLPVNPAMDTPVPPMLMSPAATHPPGTFLSPPALFPEAPVAPPVEPIAPAYSADVTATLSTGGDPTVPVAPMFRAPGGNPQVTPFTPFQNPDYQGQIAGKDIAQFLARPDMSPTAMPLITGGFGLSPEQIRSGLDTNLQYQQAMDQQKQQDFSNRITQLATAGGMDDRAAQNFSRRIADEGNSLGLDAAKYNFLNGETPQQTRMRNAEVAAKLAKYKGELDLQKLTETAKLSLTTGDLSDAQKIQLNTAVDMLKKWQASVPEVDIAKAIKEGKMEVLYQALSSGSTTPESIKIRESLPWVIDTLKKYGQIESAAQVGIPDGRVQATPAGAPTAGAIDINEYIKSLGVK